MTINHSVFELDHTNFGIPIPKQHLTYVLIDGSEQFRDLFYFLCTLNQLQRLGFISNYVKVPEDFNLPYWDLRNTGYRLDDLTVDKVLKRIDWSRETKLKTKKFFTAFETTDYFKNKVNDGI